MLRGARVEYLSPDWRRQFLFVFILLCACQLPAQAQQSSAGGSFLLASDLHFNPMADGSLVGELAAAEPERWETILERSKKTAFSQYGEDTNWWLLQSSFNAMRTTLPHPAFILVTGDLLAHQFPQTYLQVTHDTDREHYRQFVLKTVEFLALQLRKRFGATEILLTPGNNDENCGNYSIEAGGPFLHDTAGIARKLAQANEDFDHSWEALGSYDVPHPTIGDVRIISLNSIFFSAKYHAAKFSEGCASVDSTAASDLFGWLESRLAAAQQAHEKVWLMFHIPPGIDSYTTIQKYRTLAKAGSQTKSEDLCASAIVSLWAPKWTAQFESLLGKYHDTVMASLAGHTHNDDFRIIGPAGKDRDFVLISPAVSPVYNQNPAFRTITYAKDGSLTDDAVYYLANITFASSTTRGEWQREYRSSQEWKAPRLDAATLAALASKIKSDETTRNDWLKLYNVSSAAAYLPPNSMLGLYCALEELDAKGYSECYCGGGAPNAGGGR
jgi:hypothetical protein